MMKWGKRGLHSPPTYLINHVFPISWLRKLKPKSLSVRPGTEQVKSTPEVPQMARCSSMPMKWKEGRFYSGTDDLYWRLSFGDETLEDSKGGDVRSTWYDSDDAFNVQKSGSRSKSRQQSKVLNMQQKNQLKGVKTRESNFICSSCSSRMTKENCSFANENPEEEFSLEMQKLQCKEVNEMISKNEHHRLSVHVSRRVRIKRRTATKQINSPTRKNAAKNECKTGHTRKETRKKRVIKDIDIGVEAETAFDSYAVQKSSYDPEQDFRESMVEMIIDKGIKQHDELEELLVCYLSHNCDEYHDLIIKVFRQVYFDLNQV